jgi:hypothetical protein
MTELPKPDDVAGKIVDLCLPSLNEHGRYYSYRAGRFMDFQPPA